MELLEIFVIAAGFTFGFGLAILAFSRLYPREERNKVKYIYGKWH